MRPLICPHVPLKVPAPATDNLCMDATYISRRVAGLTGLDRTRAFSALAHELASEIGRGTLGTSALLHATTVHGWLLDQTYA